MARIAVTGATGNVGREVRAAFESTALTTVKSAERRT